MPTHRSRGGLRYFAPDGAGSGCRNGGETRADAEASGRRRAHIFFLVVDPEFDLVLGEDSALGEEFVVVAEFTEGLVERGEKW